MDVLEALRTRYTADSFDDRLPARDVIERLIESAIWAPNHRLTEPWRFHVFAGEERERMGNAIADWVASDANPESADEDEVRRARLGMMRSPVTIVVTQAGEPDGGPVRDLENYAACSAAIENMMLAAHAEGLTSKWATGRMTRYPPARDYLGLGEHDRIVGYVMLGYPNADAAPPERTRQPASVQWRGM